MTWWRKRTSQRDEINRIIVGINVRTEMELALRDMRRALEQLEQAVALIPGEETDDDGP